ncbi:MAG: acyloxyacyl hydrolase [Dysgonamonadaceae bacterium]|nr:acyloxyacyl hydrolase [Dysgonamonadaceae bacterium]
MKNRIWIKKAIAFLGIILFLPEITFAEKKGSNITNETDTSSFSSRFIHAIGVEARPEYIFPTDVFLKGENYAQKPIRNSLSTHLKYSFQHQPNTYADRIYGGAYQGVGLSYYSLDDKEELGNPIAFYLFQGARIARISHQLSFNYEWNFGVSAGWKPYDHDDNYFNIMLGSKVNAYLNTNFYLNWALSSQVDMNSGITLTHFSNGNTKFPNLGLNTAGLKIGLAYNFNRKSHSLSKPLNRTLIPKFPRHISYDLVFFGSWRRKGVDFGEKQVPSPNAYPVLGFNFASMYNFGYRFRAGVSLDGVYDGSANVYTKDYIVGTSQEFFTPPLKNQLALGLSGRAEFVMPYFTVGMGLGKNIIHGGGDLNSVYQILVLKTELSRNSYTHIGYCLHNFKTPNFLMLGIGFRFNNKYPRFHR